MNRNEYLAMLGVPDYMRGEADLSKLLPPERQTPPPPPKTAAQSAKPAQPGWQGKPASAKRVAPEMPNTAKGARTTNARAPIAKPAAAKAPLSSPNHYRPDLAKLAKLAKSEAPILEEVRSPDKPFTDDQRKQWTALQEEVSKCERCPLHKDRLNPVFGDGSPAPRLVLVGEGPGADEDYTGLPFVGRSGKLLTSMIDAMGFARPEVYICNAVKCRPPGNRKPEPAEVAACSGYLDRQLSLLRPQAILALGAVAAHRLLETDAAVGKLRGKQHSYKVGEFEFPVFVTYHPSYLLRKASEKAAAWEDIKFLISYFTGQPQ